MTTLERHIHVNAITDTITVLDAAAVTLEAALVRIQELATSSRYSSCSRHLLISASS